MCSTCSEGFVVNLHRLAHTISRSYMVTTALMSFLENYLEPV